jgi:phosphate starvation-inducible PhoH-like protein
VQISNRGNHFRVMGPGESARTGARLLRELFSIASTDRLDPHRIHVYLQESAVNEPADEKAGAIADPAEPDAVRTRRTYIRPRGANQRAYIASIRENDLCFGIGPAGTGDLPRASAVEAWSRRGGLSWCALRKRRAAWLPGGLAQKVDPYLRPCMTRSTK